MGKTTETTITVNSSGVLKDISNACCCCTSTITILTIIGFVITCIVADIHVAYQLQKDHPGVVPFAPIFVIGSGVVVVIADILVLAVIYDNANEEITDKVDLFEKKYGSVMKMVSYEFLANIAGHVIMTIVLWRCYIASNGTEISSFDHNTFVAAIVLSIILTIAGIFAKCVFCTIIFNVETKTRIIV